MSIPEQIPGYIRCGQPHIGVVWKFELLDEEHKVGIVTIETEDGSLQIGLNRLDATSLLNKLQLFLLDWPSDIQPS
jgi:hypothetical protein